MQYTYNCMHFLNETVIFVCVCFLPSVPPHRTACSYHMTDRLITSAGGLTKLFCPPAGFGLELDPTDCESEEWKSQSSL